MSITFAPPLGPTTTDLTGQFVTLNTAQTITGAKMVSASGPGIIPLVTRAAPSQTANLHEWQDSAGNLLTSIGPFGRIALNPSNAPSASAVVRATSSFGGSVAGMEGALLRHDTSFLGVSSWAAVFGNRGTGTTSSYAGAFRGRVGIEGDASVVQLVVRGAASQSQNLQQWQDSAGTVVASVSSSGVASFAAGSTVGGAAPSGTILTPGVATPTIVNEWYFNARTYGGVGAVSTVAQTGGALDWNDASNARSGSGYSLLQGNATNGPDSTTNYYHSFSWEYSKKDSTGNMTQLAVPYNGTIQNFHYRSRFSGTWTAWRRIPAASNTETISGLWTFQPAAAATVGVIVKGAASQTGYLQRFEDSAGTRVASVGPNGLIEVVGVTTGASLMLRKTSDADRSFLRWAQGTATWQAGFRGSPYSWVLEYQSGTSTPADDTGWNQALSAAADGLVTAPIGFRATAGAAATVPLIVTGAASQTGDLQRWNNSVGTLLARVLSSGSLYLTPLTGNVYGLSLVMSEAAQIGVQVRAAASQTADLQQWQNSAGTSLVKINSVGQVRIDEYNGVGGTTAYYASLAQANAHGLILRGAASQSADLTQWWTSANAVVASIDPVGRGSFGGAKISDAAVTARTINVADHGVVIRMVASASGAAIRVENSTGTPIWSVSPGGLPRWNAAGNEQTTVGAAGAAAALPATPSKYLRVIDSAGIIYVIPAYAYQ